MQTIKVIPASAASSIDSLQNLAGTKIMLAEAPVSLTASLTELKTGKSK